ncbi:nuclear transport factor 2 family protein [Variovorax sp. Sphag1AA]|uniref:nuclear transport factor 2 family protein n=1 Tax=Variovorax sp. Sphag1AA TaxID=2587027 RepID=UPI001608A6C4|nr:nuclear transport factor 2 family protein [Variovorax sp. Sphag1AA]MBB3182130.1 ketosteroid isomerase-like protein [Variovorax sp. Sphag1AA]
MSNFLDDYSPERIADRMQIQDCMYRWCRAVDRLDFSGIRDVFHHDATDMHGAYDGPVDGLIDWIRSRHAAIPFSMHAVSNLLIEFAGPDLALVETYVRTTQRYPAEARAALDQLAGGKAGADGGGMDLMTCSRYVDRFERREDRRWKIARRTLVADWKQFVPVPADLPSPPASQQTGRRNQDDFIFQERQALGIRP